MSEPDTDPATPEPARAGAAGPASAHAPASAPPPSSAGTGSPALPAARARRSRWIGTVWALPLAALAIVAFLGLRALSDRGIDVVVTFPTSGGARVDDTKVIYQGVETGRVTKIAINPDGHRVDMTIRLERAAERGLTTTTQFWLVGVNPSLNDISSVKAALAGVTIGVAPGMGGEPSRRFVGLNEPPVILPGTPGTPYTLTTDAIGNLSSGAPLYYHGQLIGRVVSTDFQGVSHFRIEVFVLAPFDRLVGTRAIFWISSPVQVSLADRGATATLEHASSLLNGAIEFDFVDGGTAPAVSAASAAGTTGSAASAAGRTGGSTQSPAGTIFPLYQARADAEAGPPGPEVPYAMRFRGRAGDLASGAPVRLAGFVVGRVKSVHLEIDPETAIATTAVRAVLYPNRLHLQPVRDTSRVAGAGPSGAGTGTGTGTTSANPGALAVPPVDETEADAGWRRATDRLVERLLANGHRATLAQTPPLIGARSISLDTVRADAPPARLGAGRLIASDDSGGGDIDQITGQVNQLLARLNRVPIEAIGQDVKQLTARLANLVGSPELKSSLQHLNTTLAQADAMLAGAAPKIEPLLNKLNATADEITATAGAARGLLTGEGRGGRDGDASLPAAIQELSDAARSIRTLSDYLGRHPEALLRGRRDEPAETLPGAASGGKGGTK